MIDQTNKDNITTTFKVGDIICGIKRNGYSFTNENMKKAKVIKLYSDGTMKIQVVEHKFSYKRGNIYTVSNNSKKFMLVEKCKKSINITTDGVTITRAVLIDGKKEIEYATARCNPIDEFDFNIGAKIAFDRLMDKVTTLRLVHGDKVLGIIGESIEKEDNFGNELHVGDIVTNIVLENLEDEIVPKKTFAKAMCINKDELVFISKTLYGDEFDINGVIALVSPYTKLIEEGRGYKINDNLEVR